jgi:hypothetical protein
VTPAAVSGGVEQASRPQGPQERAGLADGEAAGHRALSDGCIRTGQDGHEAFQASGVCQNAAGSPKRRMQCVHFTPLEVCNSVMSVQYFFLRITAILKRVASQLMTPKPGRFRKRDFQIASNETALNFGYLLPVNKL